MYLSASHKTVKNILARKAFTVSMADADHVTECDYLGIVSANQVPDKVARAGFHVTKSAHVDAPLVDELPWPWSAGLLALTRRVSCWWARSSTSVQTSAS